MSNVESTAYWRKCSSCKAPITFNSRHYVCSVSTCNGQRTGYVFCSVSCFERHLPGARHKDAAAIEETAPRGHNQSTSLSPSTSSVSAPVTSTTTFTRPPGPGQAPTRTIIRPSTPTASSAAKLPREVLVIASRLKEYIDARSEYATSASVMDVLSDHLRILADHAIDNARADGRKTVMDRDFAFLKSFK